jgi:hypothetical protein
MARAGEKAQRNGNGATFVPGLRTKLTSKVLGPIRD